MEHTIRQENGLTVVGLVGSINSANVGEFEKLIAEEPSQDGLVIDAKELAYISSAGLRVILAAKKRCKDKTFRVINVNDEVMNIFDVTGFSEIMEISRAVRSISVEGCDKIGAGACGEVFRLDDETIIKLYYPRVKQEEIEQEKALAKKAFVLGVPTAISYDIVECGGRTGVVYELIKSKTLGELIREDEANLEKYVDMYAEVCRQIHSIEAEPNSLPSFKDINRADIPNITGVTDEERQYLYDFLDLVPDRSTCIHGDLNINNIMVQNGECCLIDMGEFSTGLSMFDISRLVFSMEIAVDETVEFNSFYKMPQATVDRILQLLLQKYFEADTLEEAEAKNPDVRWLYPLARFRTALRRPFVWRTCRIYSRNYRRIIPLVLRVLGRRHRNTSRLLSGGLSCRHIQYAYAA